MPSSAAVSPIYRRLQRRNGVVRVLRFAVPVAGVFVLLALLVQIALSSLGGRFSVGSISVSPEAVTVEAPQYFGVLQDGSSYRVSAARARAATGSPELIGLAEAKLVYDRADGVQFTVDAAQAELDTASQLVDVPGVADVSNSQGMIGTLSAVTFDFRAQLLTGKGPVRIEQADGTTVEAEGVLHDAATDVWTFTRSVVTLPSTPGEDFPTAPDGVLGP